MLEGIPVTGAPTILSDDATPNTDNPSKFPQGIVLDESNGRLLVTDGDLNAVIAVVPVSGYRVIVSK